MPTPHNTAQKGEIAKTVLLPGDPLRAKFLAENFLENPVQFNSVRNMLGYTGAYQGKPVSVMGTGMGCPSIAIYAYELIHFYGVENLIRIGSCGSLQENLKVGDILIAMGASSNSNFADQFHLPGTFAPLASFSLLEKAVSSARRHAFPFAVGNVLSSDIFYYDSPEDWKAWLKMGVMACEMESYALYCLAARAGVNALGIFTVSDSMVVSEEMSPQERETGLQSMMQVALDVAGEIS